MTKLSLPVSTTATASTALPLDPRTYKQALSCVHCGLCLPACPTYVETGHESDSPRGRIQLMRGLADGAIALTGSVQKHLDLCLDCRGCETACPSGVVYHELIEETRAHQAGRIKHTISDKLLRWMLFNIFTHPARLKLALLPVRLLQRAGLYPLLRKWGFFRRLPAPLARMEQMLPQRGAVWPGALPLRMHGAGFNSLISSLSASRKPAGPRPSVGFFAGCIGSVMYAEVNRKAAELLAASGMDVVCPPAQRCCGAIHHHNGDIAAAAQLARHNIDVFDASSSIARDDAIVTTVAGCGAMLRDYPHLLRDDPAYSQRAVQFAHRVRDISEVLNERTLPPLKSVRKTVTYHDACHLAHAQKVTAAPRALLAKIPGLLVVPLHECDMCCGAAGTYNLVQPEMAARLGKRKLANITATGAAVCVTGNVGCAMQIQSQAAAAGQQIDVLHPVELLHESVFRAAAPRS